MAVIGIPLEQRYSYNKDIPIIGMSHYMDTRMYNEDLIIIERSLSYGYPYYTDIPIIWISLLYGYPYTMEIPIIGISL